jgi:hypothetical protein
MGTTISKTRRHILSQKIKAIEQAIKSNDVYFISKWHGTLDYALKDLHELKTELNNGEGAE